MKDSKLLAALILVFGGVFALVAEDNGSSSSSVLTSSQISYDDNGEELEIYYPQSVSFKKIFKNSSLYSSYVDNGVYQMADGTQVRFSPDSDEDNYVSDLQTAIKSKEADMYVVSESDLSSFLYSSLSKDLINDLGISSDRFSHQYECVLAKGMDSSSNLRASCFEVSSGLFAYRRDIASSVFSTDDPDAIQEKLKDLSSFNNAALTLKEKGYKMLSSSNDDLHPFYSQTSSSLVDSASYFHLPSSFTDWVEEEKYLFDNDCSNRTEYNNMYWESDHQYGSSVFGFYLSSEQVNDLVEESIDDSSAVIQEGNGLYGKWGLCQGPLSYRRDNYYLLVSPYCDRMTAAKTIVDSFTCDQSELRKMAVNSGILVNSAYAIQNAEETQTSQGVSSLYNPCFKQDVLSLYAEQVKEDALGEKRTSYDKKILALLGSDFTSYFKSNDTYENCLEVFNKHVKTLGLKIPSAETDSEASV